MYTIDEVFEQALKDGYTANLNGDGYESRSIYGIKIIRDIETREITLLNTMKGGDYYMPITKDEVNIFLEKGWRIGVYVVTLSNYRIKLEQVEKKIRDEVNGKSSDKVIQELKDKRTSLLNSYTELNNKLNGKQKIGL